MTIIAGIQFSEHICSESGCNRKIKQKIVNQNPDLKDYKCYEHHVKSTGKQGRREFFKGKKIN